MQRLKLNHSSWEIDTEEPLGAAGGFGEVFLGKGDSGEVAIKRLKLTAADAAHRELSIGQSLFGRSLQHIVPILDYGQDADSDRYYIVMPVCDQSLQDEINDKGALSPDDCIEILLAILNGLQEAKDIIHRDIKPANILKHGSVWKIADFGIAKFVEDSTSLETLKNNLTPTYAAPEQWLLQPSTNATDIYSVGCIAHALITGEPPFDGDMDSLREKHLKAIPKTLDSLPASVRSLISQMMRKIHDIRPKLERCISVLDKAKRSGTGAIRNVDNNIADAISELAITQAKAEAENKIREERRQNRELIFREATNDLARVKNRLFEEIRDHAQDVMEKSSGDYFLKIGKAKLNFDTSLSYKGIQKSDHEQMVGDGGWGVHKRKSNWDIVALANISIEQQNGHIFLRRCANLVFGRPNEDSDFRWYEMAFWSSSQPQARNPESYPFCLELPFYVDEALSDVMGVNNLAYEPKPIDAEDEDSFVEYWMDIIAKAMVGKLVKPSRMPMER